MIDMRRHLLAGQALSGSCQGSPGHPYFLIETAADSEAGQSRAGWFSPPALLPGRQKARQMKFASSSPPAAVEPTHAASYLNF